MKKHSVHARLAAALVLALSLAGCGEQGQAEELVRANLKDPESARFGEFYYSEAKGRACLEVNAKNSLGGYVGDRQAKLKHSAEGWEFVDFMDESSSRSDCRDYWADAV